MPIHASRRLLAICALLLWGTKQITHPVHAFALPRAATTAGPDPVGTHVVKRRCSDKPLRVDERHIRWAHGLLRIASFLD